MIPSRKNLLTLDNSYLGEPFCNVTSKNNGPNLLSIDNSFLGEPFVSNPNDFTLYIILRTQQTQFLPLMTG